MYNLSRYKCLASNWTFQRDFERLGIMSYLQLNFIHVIEGVVTESM